MSSSRGRMISRAAAKRMTKSLGMRERQVQARQHVDQYLSPFSLTPTFGEPFGFVPRKTRWRPDCWSVMDGLDAEVAGQLGRPEVGADVRLDVRREQLFGDRVGSSRRRRRTGFGTSCRCRRRSDRADRSDDRAEAEEAYRPSPSRNCSGNGNADRAVRVRGEPDEDIRPERASWTVGIIDAGLDAAEEAGRRIPSRPRRGTATVCRR